MTFSKDRMAYLDYLRILACFLVIVNHTNPAVYSVASVHGLTWYASLLYHYLCRMAVPLFLMISGACLLHKRDSWKKVIQRVSRIAILLWLFSNVHFFLNISWNEPAAQIIKQYFQFLGKIWQTPAVGAYWYLYLYLGLLFLTPFLQSMVQGLKAKDFKFGLVIWLVFGSGMLLLGHYWPEAVASSDLLLPMFSDFVCCMVAGYYICHHSKARHPIIAFFILICCIATQTILTRIEYNHVPEGSLNYLFLDWRIHPSLFMLISALCTMYTGKAIALRQTSFASHSLVRELSACSLSIYLVHSWVVEATRNTVYLPLADTITALPAVLIWEVFVFLICALFSMLLRRVPLLRKLL